MAKGKKRKESSYIQSKCIQEVNTFHTYNQKAGF